MADWWLDAQVDLRRSLRMEQPWKRYWNSIEPTVFALVAGAGIGVVAAAIAVAAEFLASTRFGWCTSHFYLGQQFCCWMDEMCDSWYAWTWAAFPLYVLFSIVFALASVRLVMYYAPHATGHGIPELKSILGGFSLDGVLTWETLFVKAFALIFAVASGLSVGKEGPLVHIACCIGFLLSQMFPRFRNNQAMMRNASSATAAAGIAVAFGAPLGGVLFSLEELAYHFPYQVMWSSFLCAMAASVALQVMNPFRTGKLVLFQTASSFENSWLNFELPLFIAIGMLGGVFGVYFNKYALKMDKLRESRWSDRPSAMKDAVFVAGITSLVSYLFSYTQIDATEFLSLLFNGCTTVTNEMISVCASADSLGTIALFLFITAIIKFALTLLAFGLHLPSGYYLPVMAIGASFGRACGIVMQMVYLYSPGFFLFFSCPSDKQCINPAVYALVGSAAAMASVTKTSVALVVIMFELTGALHLVLPLMLVGNSITLFIVVMMDSYSESLVFVLFRRRTRT